MRPLMFTVALLGATAAHATPLVYTPINPAFGGSPLHGAYLLGRAQAIDRHKDPDAPAAFNPSSSASQLETFNNTLQQVVLSRLAAAASSSVTGPDGKLIPGIVQTQNFTITITDLGGGKLRIITLDKLTGQSTSFDITQ